MKTETSKEIRMPRGVPKKGYRMTAARKAEMAGSNVKPIASVKGMVAEPAKKTTETDAQIDAKLRDRFEVLALMTDAAITGDARALIVSGPPGLGKSFEVERVLDDWDPTGKKFSVIKGHVKATGLYKKLYQHRKKGQVIVFDDSDTVFTDEVSLNMLKAVCDTTDKRVISYLSEYNMVDEETSDVIPKSFAFEGTIIFITNLDFDGLIEKGHKIAPHLSALISRSHYIDLAMKTQRDYVIRIRQVVKAGMLKDHGLTVEQAGDVMKFVEDNVDNLRELSLRMVIKVATLRKNKPAQWKKIAGITCCKNQ